MEWEAVEMAPAISGLDDAWEMYCSAGPAGSDQPLRHFGRLGYAQQDPTASRVLQVWLVATDDPQPGDYWAWHDHGVIEPCHISATEEILTQAFLTGQADAAGPREEEQVGLGRILRLRVTVLGEVFLRSGRSNWKFSSAQ